MFSSNSDIISHLPSSVLQEILMFLSIQDAVRTSVLSRKWRYIWAELPQLVFDDTFFRESIRTVKNNKLILTIYKVLLLHRGPITKFTLSLPELGSCTDIDQLILFVTKNGVQEFSLRVWKPDCYKLPSSLFSCLQLEHMDLRSCMFKPPHGFKGFSRLLSLTLCEVVITDDVFSNLISTCPLLETLWLEMSTSLDYLEIAAPNLTFLYCEGIFRGIDLKTTPYIEEVSIILKEYRKNLVFKEGEPFNLVMLLESIPVIEDLQFDHYYVKCMAAGGVPKRLPTTLNYLKVLRLCEICFGALDEVSVVLCLIRSSPNLQEISIQAYPGETAAIDPILDLLEVHYWSDVPLKQLCKVDFGNVSGTRPELGFIKLLLAKSPMLKKLLIELDSEDVAEQNRILRELTRFQRASPQAEIIFENPDEDSDED
ncbi:F-box/FBD/LRR-repeat protein At1g13570-like [Actinidia eriantha]|uniref:F-box/FBD/LRR-repeat protein At1g13570-like n=1 Tax=Actinidia eriantha TaxID=165200 RepID=UPI0025889494|nr:F-box/FBD/LRR-repeat protein At1g13570-like [Actinidia eriantha]